MTLTTQNNDTAPVAENSTAKHLTFALGAESYGIPVLKVREIIRPSEITIVPRMPAFVRGVINLRGKIIPIIDLRLKFQLAAASATERTCIVVVEVGGAGNGKALMGLIVDAVEEVMRIAAEDVEPTPSFGARLDTRYLLGIAKVKGGVKTLLDIDTLLAAEATAEISEFSPAA